MRVVTTKELSNYKILPFDLYNDSNSKVLGAGEVLTPGKLIMLKNYTKLFTEELFSDGIKGQKNSGGKSNVKKLSNFSYDNLDVTDFETVINREGTLKSETQVRIKYFYRKTLDLFLAQPSRDLRAMTALNYVGYKRWWYSCLSKMRTFYLTFLV